MEFSKHEEKFIPSAKWRIISFIPGINFIAVSYISIRNAKKVSSLCAVIYGVLTYAFIDASPAFWLAGIIHYAFLYRSILNQLIEERFTEPGSAQPQTRIQKDSRKKISIDSSISSVFSDVVISGDTEKKQSIPLHTIPTPIVGNFSFSVDTSRNKFFNDMKKYANTEVSRAVFVPFMTYWPTYDSMTKEQQAWYFYWRSQIRSGNYPDTDLSYIFIYIYELLSGIGWKSPKEGFNWLVDVWAEYRGRFPYLCNYMFGWTFDFSCIHNLAYSILFEDDALRLSVSPKTDVLISQYADDVPLKLPFLLISALCDYSLTGSKFYKDGNQELIRQAIPRVVALADASLQKKISKGILNTYGPTRTKKQEYYLFQSAVCPYANKKIEFKVKAYSSNPKLRNYLNELVRYAENTLREIGGYRGRLRGITLDDETAKLVSAFLKKEYGKPALQKNKNVDNATVTLDFDNIDALRSQSDAVRDALLVESNKPSASSEKALLTELNEVIAMYTAITPEAKSYMDSLAHSNWECSATVDNEILVAEINRIAERYLKSHLLISENSIVIVEDDYRDELEHIYSNTHLISDLKQKTDIFDVFILNDVLKMFIDNLMPEQMKALYALLTLENPQNELEKIAEDAMTMPQILLDDINAVAVQILGEILVDSIEEEHCILEEYAETLKQSIR